MDSVFKAIYDSPDCDEWWATDKADEFVFVVGKQAVRVKVSPERLPEQTPADYFNGTAPHPFGYKG